MTKPRSRSGGALRTNWRDLVMVAVAGQVAHPVGPVNPYRIGNDGVPRVLPATGGIVLNRRVGDAAVGMEGDHIEPGVAVRNNLRESLGDRKGPNRALITYACVGNRARIISGPCTGRWGLVTGKHGGVDHLIVDFPPAVLANLNIGDRIQIYSCGLGLRLVDYPQVTLFNCAPSLLARWGIRPRGGKLEIPITHRIPAAVMGSGLGKNTVWRGDYDIQLFDPDTRRRFRLNGLRLGDLVAIEGADTRFGPSPRHDRRTIGIVVHGDSTGSGHGPGVTPLLTGPAETIAPTLDPGANLARVFELRTPAPARSVPTLIERERAAAR